MSLNVMLYSIIDTGGDKPFRHELFENSITQNLEPMAKEAGLYEYLWTPETIGATHARDIISGLEEGIVLLDSDPKRFKAFNAKNGWGVYSDLVSFVGGYLIACREHPKCLIDVDV